MPCTRRVNTPERIFNRVRRIIFLLPPEQQLKILRAIAARAPETSTFVRQILTYYGPDEQERVNDILSETCHQLIAEIEAAAKSEVAV